MSDIRGQEILFPKVDHCRTLCSHRELHRSFVLAKWGYSHSGQTPGKDHLRREGAITLIATITAILMLMKKRWNMYNLVVTLKS